jgi:glycosyltransferase involved in cell wall biosynthesis
MARRVSIIIPCYEQAHFLAEAVESALAQSYHPLDVTVVDDGSGDATAEVAAAYPDVRRVRQHNQGVSAARNAGLGASHGEYVVFLDADDRLLPGAAEAGVDALEAAPTAALAAGRSRRIAVDGAPLPTTVRARVTHDHYAAFVRRCWLGVPEAMHRRQALTAVGGFDRRLRCAEDYDLYLRLARRFPVVDHYEPVAEYRQHRDSLSRNAEQMLAATLAALAPHRPGPGAPRALDAAWRARENVVWYLDRLLESAVDDLVHRRGRSATRRLLIFVRYLPSHPDYARRRARGLLRRLAARKPRRPSAARPAAA